MQMLGARGLQYKLVLSLILGVGVVLALALYANAPSLLATLRSFRWELVPLVLGLTLLNYALRFLKWHFYLRQIGVRIAVNDSFAIFCSGLSMAMTPGKVGEVLKPVLLKLRTGTPVSRSAPVVVAERLTDGIAMIILAIGGLLLSRQAWQIILVSFVLAGVVVTLLGTGTGTGAVLRLSHQLPFVGARAAHIEAFLASSRILFTPWNLALAVGIGVVSWSGEGVALYLILLGLGFHASATLAVQAIFVLSASSLVGSLSLVPGGLGVADASVAGLLIVIVHAVRVKAAAATLLIRFCTLWFGVAIGMVSLVVFRRRFHPARGDSVRQDDDIEAMPVGGNPA
jgi:glycosyltransferase 2 family protein